MEYTLMHKDISVLEIELDEATSSMQKLGAVHHLEHLPLGTVSKHSVIDRAALNVRSKHTRWPVRYPQSTGNAEPPQYTNASDPLFWPEPFRPILGQAP